MLPGRSAETLEQSEAGKACVTVEVPSRWASEAAADWLSSGIRGGAVLTAGPGGGGKMTSEASSASELTLTRCTSSYL